MTEDHDHADAEVRGVSRYIPTTLSKTILTLLPVTTYLSFVHLREHSEWFLPQSLTELEKTLISALIAMLVACILTLVLVIDMAVAVHQSKHRRIVHYSQEHPLMSFKFLIQNATVYHWLALGFLSTVCFAAGYSYA